MILPGQVQIPPTTLLKIRIPSKTLSKTLMLPLKMTLLESFLKTLSLSTFNVQRTVTQTVNFTLTACKGVIKTCKTSAKSSK